MGSGGANRFVSIKRHVRIALCCEWVGTNFWLVCFCPGYGDDGVERAVGSWGDDIGVGLGDGDT